jgi:DNA-directed RNA polymerase specialized sigma24 family protein
MIRYSCARTLGYVSPEIKDTRQFGCALFAFASKWVLIKDLGMSEEAKLELSTTMGKGFATTHWSVVLAAGQTADLQASEALEQLCRTYWYPLYSYIRRRGQSPEQAQDLTQQFFALFLRKDYFRLADRARGKFRTFLLHALERFLINEWKRTQCAKRGAGAVCLSLDVEGAELRFAKESAVTMTPERAYERRAALSDLGRQPGQLTLNSALRIQGVTPVRFSCRTQRMRETFDRLWLINTPVVDVALHWTTPRQTVIA